MAYVIAVAAPIGGGKTALVRALAARLGNATAIHFDRYEKVTREPVERLHDWIAKGANFDDFNVPGLAEDLKRLKRGESITDPFTKEETPSGKYIVFEMPLGRERTETASLIDLLIWVEVPLDVALARKLKEFTSFFLEKQPGDAYRDCLAWMDTYLDHYLKVVRRVLHIQKARVSAAADLILDGQADVEAMVREATGEILRRLP